MILYIIVSVDYARKWHRAITKMLGLLTVALKVKERCKACSKQLFGLFLDIKVTKYKKYIYKYYTI